MDNSPSEVPRSLFLNDEPPISNRLSFSLSPFSLLLQYLRELLAASGRAEAFSGGDAVWEWLRRSSDLHSVFTRCRCLSSVANGSRVSDLGSHIWYSLLFISFFVLLMLELMRMEELTAGISANKAPLASSSALLSWRDAGRYLLCSSDVLPRWEDEEVELEEGFFNKRLHPQVCSPVADPLFLAGLGGEGKEGRRVVTARSKRCCSEAVVPYPGVHQQRTRDDGHVHLASASYGRMATLLDHVSSVALLPPGHRPMWRIFSSSRAPSSGAGPSGSSPVPASLA